VFYSGRGEDAMGVAEVFGAGDARSRLRAPALQGRIQHGSVQLG